ncbi:MAG: ABC transporter ATP-binding protein [Cohaesibacter sp.]|jgi:branched-chain amino acid transport system ATP-binding protein|nr:ABC transporter ATP-binding protein [Cohaesibacter sp.]
MTLLKVDKISIEFGGLKAVDEVSFTVDKGQIVSIIGPNGAGKTTLFNLISGVYKPSGGEVYLNGTEVTALEPNELAKHGLSRTFQNLQIFFRMTVIENVMVGCHLREKRFPFPHLFSLPSVERQNNESRAKALKLLERVGLADKADEMADSMSYGALKRLEIARALAAESEIILLDEPAAGCNPIETEEIDNLIHDIAHKDGITVLLVEHDMKLVMKISDKIIVLDYGKKLVEGTAAEVRRHPDVIAAYLGDHGSKEAARAG